MVWCGDISYMWVLGVIGQIEGWLLSGLWMMFEVKLEVVLLGVFGCIEMVGMCRVWLLMKFLCE